MRAFIASTAVHAVMVATAAWWASRSLAPAPDPAAAWPIALLGTDPLDDVRARSVSPTPAATTPAPAAPATVPEPPPPAPGDRARVVLSPTAPTRVPNPDERASAAAASSGDGPGVIELALTDRRDADTMRNLLLDADAGYRLPRIRSGPERVSREEVRSTPHPGLTPDLASRAGDGIARGAPGARPAGGAPRAGAIAVAARVGAAGGLAPRPSVASPASSGIAAPPSVARAVSMRVGVDGEEAPGFQRPYVQRGPAETESERRADRVADDRDSALVSSELRPGPIELSQPAIAGSGREGRGRGVRPAWAPIGTGWEAVPAGSPSAPRGEDLQLATYRRHYNHYLADVVRKIDPLWEFPRELALRLEQGDVRVGFVIRRDGSIKDVRVLKSSGWKSFDSNVVEAVRRAAPFGPLPDVFGSELAVQPTFVAQNPLVR